MARKKLKVAISNITPFVIEKENHYSGFEIELWEKVAKKIGRTFVYEKHHFQDLIPLLTNKQADIALAAITIKEKREKIIDFSFSTFDSGLGILLAKNRQSIDWSETITDFFTQGYKSLFKPFLVLIIIFFILGNILWLVEKPEYSFAQDYSIGIFQSTWLSLSTMLGSPTIVATYEINSWAGRLLLQFTVILKLAILGLFISQLTAFLTARKIRLNIQGPHDLKGKKVATIKEATSEHSLRNLGATIVTVKKIEQAYVKLKRREVDAVVFDRPILTYYALNEGSDWSELVGETFDKQKYGLALQNKSSLREEINQAVLALRENGQYDELYKKWFGDID